MIAVKDQFPTFTWIGAWILAIPKALSRFVRRVWRPVLTVFLLLAATHGIATFVLGRKVAMEIQKIKARGEFVSVADLAGPKIPDAENGAVIYERAFKLLPDQRNITVKMDYTDILNPDKRNNPAIWKSAEVAVVKHARMLALAEEAAAVPKCRFNTNWEAGPNALFPYCSSLRELARLAAARAILQARNGKMDESARSVGLVFRASDSIKNDPYLIHFLVRWAMIDIAARALRDVARYGEISENEARRLSDQLSTINLGPDFVTSLKGERAMVLWQFDHIRKQGVSQLYGECASGFRFKLRGAYIGRPLLYIDELDSLRFWRTQMSLVKLPFREIKRRNLKLLDDRGGPFGAFFCPIFVNARSAADAGQAQVIGSRILLALTAFKSRFGAYPNSLNELNTAIDWKVPLEDPFSGKDFIYKREGKGFIFYSIGQNLKDDGGVEPKGNHPNTGDIVWKMDH